MREIRFRAWDKAAQRMRYVNCAGECFLLKYDGWNLGEIDYDFAVLGADSYSGDELMQFTGLVDKNGKEIYEGDIVRLCEVERAYTVEWIDFGFKLVHAEPKMNRMEWGSLNRIKELFFTCELIGNIHEPK